MSVVSCISAGTAGVNFISKLLAKTKMISKKLNDAEKMDVELNKLVNKYLDNNNYCYIEDILEYDIIDNINENFSSKILEIDSYIKNLVSAQNWAIDKSEIVDGFLHEYTNILYDINKNSMPNDLKVIAAEIEKNSWAEELHKCDIFR